MSTKKKNTQWFVEPRDDWSNELISRLIGFSQIEAESTGLNVPDNNGQGRNIWQCSWADLEFLHRSKARLQMSFRVYKRNGNTGSIYPAPKFAQVFPKKRRKTLRTARRPAIQRGDLFIKTTLLRKEKTNRKDARQCRGALSPL